jgi:Domain of unknown function (DUF932)
VDLRYEVGLSELGEWMNFRVYFPDSYSFTDAHGYKLDLRLECFNSVDGSSRLMILFGWFRFICANGLVIGETKIEIKERHGKSLVLDSIRERIWPEFEAVETDKSRMQKWQDQKVDIEGIAAWADKKLSEKWGKKAAARVFHIIGTTPRNASPGRPRFRTCCRVSRSALPFERGESMSLSPIRVHPPSIDQAPVARRLSSARQAGFADLCAADHNR